MNVNKIVTTAVIIFIAFINFAYSQDIIPKKANTIIVKDVSFNEIVNRLLDSGFIINLMDKEYQFVKTEYKKVCLDCVPSVMYNIRIKDSAAIIKGTWQSSGNFLQIGMGSNNETLYVFPIQNEKLKVPKTCFSMMNNFALSFNKPVQYLIEK